MRSVWVTRSEPGAAKLAAYLTAQGFAAFALPLIEIQWLLPYRVIVNGTPATGASELVEPPALVCALSAHAVEAFAATDLAARAGSARYVAVGERTAAALSEIGCDAQVPEQASSEGLLAMAQFKTLSAGDTVWILAGSGGRDVLERNLLHMQGARVVKLELYRRVSADPGAELDAREVGVVEVASVQGVEAFARAWQRIGGAESVPLIVPSARVGQAARTLGFANVHVSAGASDAAVLTQLRKLMRQNDEVD